MIKILLCPSTSWSFLNTSNLELREVIKGNKTPNHFGQTNMGNHWSIPEIFPRRGLTNLKTTWWFDWWNLHTNQLLFQISKQIYLQSWRKEWDLSKKNSSNQLDITTQSQCAFAFTHYSTPKWSLGVSAKFLHHYVLDSVQWPSLTQGKHIFTVVTEECRVSLWIFPPHSFISLWLSPFSFLTFTHVLSCCHSLFFPQ